MAKKRDELEFGSDSFLDVLANVVGILIILIVVVGVRVANSPKLALPGPAPKLQAESSRAPESPAPLPAIPAFPPLREIEPPAELLAQAEALRRKHASMESELNQLDREKERLASLHRDHEVRSAALRQQITGKIELLRSERTAISSLEQEIAGLKQEITGWQQKLATAGSDEVTKEKLTHRLPPIGRLVDGQEIHFRLSENRISRVPVMELAQEVQRDIDRRKEVLLSRKFYQGITRPMEGYTMEYVIQRMAMSVTDEMRGVIRIGVSMWMIRPGGQIMSETTEEALRPGSRFHQALLRSGSNATLTFWVYPDSFEIHQRLKAFAHDSGYWVASRPLPAGVPITGSPQGSKSLAQ
jgi:hypothetical protein